MAATPKELQAAVIEDINWMAGPLARNPVRKNDKLDVKFGLTAYQRRALAAPFEETARRWKFDARIGREACEKLSNAGGAVDLVSKAAGFDGSWNEE